MSDQETWLISLSIGPVQDFISAALRTRDLWFGSHMLSEVSREAARKMNTYDAAELIFPAVEKNSNELEPDSSLNVANRIVAEVQGDKKTVESIINAGKQAAQDQLNIFITQAKKKAAIGLRDDIWDIQTKRENLLELYGTAVRITDGKYPDAWERLSRLNSARKNSRDFLQPAKAPNEEGLYGLPKSSLDGRRETVLPKELNKNTRRRLRMGDGEQLDVLGLVKRLAGGELDEQKQFNPTSKLQFTPTTRIAIDPWVRNIEEIEKKKTPPGSTLKKIYSELKKHEKLLMNAGLMTKVQGNEEIYKDMPFDAGLLYRSVLDANIQKSRHEERSEDKKLLKKLRNEILQDVWKEYRQPCPYYAMLLADGDHMGNLIKAAEGKKQHQEISKCLSAFAQGVPATARDHQAHCIYAGGDDVLLMAPLDTVLDLADELRTTFTEKLQEVADDLGQDAPTFSVGIVIAHMQAPIGRVRRLVSEAEALAKGSDKKDPRNALAIIVAPRSGADMSFRARWERKPAQKRDGAEQDEDEQDKQKSPVEELNELAKLYRNDELPSGFGYELRQIDQLVHDMEDKARAGEIAELELERILNRKNQGGGGKKVEQKTKDAVLDHAKSKGSFTMIWQEHLIARWLGAHREERG